MCLIIRCDNRMPISRRLMEEFHRQNDDGWGMMWIQDNTLKTIKSSNPQFQPLWNKYKEVREHNPIIHVRYRTHGKIDHDNTHPFYCGFGIFMMHNGVVGIETPNNEKSDTWHLVEHWLKPLFSKVPNPHELIRKKAFIKDFEEMVGTQNRIVMGDRGGFVYYNLPSWHTIGAEKTGCQGMLVSNQYAWDESKFKEVVVYRGTLPATPTRREGPYEKNQHGVEMIPLYAEVHEDMYGQRWKKTAPGQYALLYSPPPIEGPKQHLLEIPEDITTEAAKEWVRSYTRTFKNSSYEVIEKVVMKLPKHAAKLLHGLLQEAQVS